MTRMAWAAAALVAAAFLVGLAFTGGRGGPGLEPFVPKGLLTISVEDVREVDVAAPRGHWHFVRTQDGWRATQGTATAGFEARLESHARDLRGTVQQWTGIPVSVGIAPTKTLAKVANRFAKKNPLSGGVSLLLWSCVAIRAQDPAAQPTASNNHLPTSHHE